jgi:TonB family protein
LLSIIQLSVVAAYLFAAVSNTKAQETPAPAKEPEVVLTKVIWPSYPPLARQARIMGDVKIQVGVRKDGSTVSAEVISGHPMLKQAALDSVRKSTFECRECSADLNLYTVTYTFGVRADGDCNVKHLRASKCLYLWKCGDWREADQRPPAVAQWQGHITVLVDSPCLNTATASS